MKEFAVGLITVGLMFLIAAYLPIIVKTIAILMILFMVIGVIYIVGVLVCSLFE